MGTGGIWDGKRPCCHKVSWHDYPGVPPLSTLRFHYSVVEAALVTLLDLSDDPFYAFTRMGLVSASATQGFSLGPATRLSRDMCFEVFRKSLCRVSLDLLGYADTHCFLLHRKVCDTVVRSSLSSWFQGCHTHLQCSNTYEFTHTEGHQRCPDCCKEIRNPIRNLSQARSSSLQSASVCLFIYPTFGWLRTHQHCLGSFVRHCLACMVHCYLSTANWCVCPTPMTFFNSKFANYIIYSLPNTRYVSRTST